MPARNVNLFLVAVGLVVVIVLFVWGVDVYRASCTGPRWKRRLFGAGLALLVLLGLAPAGCAEGGEAKPPPPVEAADDLENSPEWKRVVKVWEEAEEIASGKRGSYPFNRAGRQRMLDSLASASRDVDSLAEAGKLSAAAAALLKKDLETLAKKVQQYLPTEMREVTCYRRMFLPPARESAERLAERLPFLEKLVAAERLRPVVARKILVSVERELAVLAQAKMLEQLSEAERERAEKTREAVKKLAEKLKARLEGNATDKTGGDDPIPVAPKGDAEKGKLEQSAGWKVVTGAWAFALPFAESGKSTTAQRQQATEKLNAATKAARDLATQGLLTAQEAELLVQEAEKISQDIYRDPPTDCRVMCYDMVDVPPSRRSFERLSARLPLVEKLAAGGKVQPAALAKVLETIEADLAVLSQEKELGRLPAAERAQAEKTRDEMKKQLARLKTLLEAK